MENKINQPPKMIDTSTSNLKALEEIKNSFIKKVMSTIDDIQLIPVYLSKLYPHSEDINVLYQQLVDLKKCLDSFRPFDIAQMKNLQEVFDTEYTYASNRIEGNTLTLQETSFVINEGLTIGNKSMKEHLEAINHKEAINFIRELAVDNEPINQRNIKLIHSLILQGIDRKHSGIYRKVSVGIKGTNIIFPEPFKIQQLMDELYDYYHAKKDSLHPVKLATVMHSKLVNIHPFIDGNGRTSRLLMNLILLKNGYPVTNFSPEETHRSFYFNVLNIAREQNNSVPFEKFVAKNVKTWIINYLNMLAPSISEDSKDKGGYFFRKIQPYLTEI